MAPNAFGGTLPIELGITVAQESRYATLLNLFLAGHGPCSRFVLFAPNDVPGALESFGGL